MRELVIWPDDRLAKKCVEVDIFDLSVVELANDMIRIMLSNNGVGLAATQVGSDKRVLIMSPDGHPEVVINPVLLRHGKQTEIESEGCLSFPGQRKPIERWTVIDVRYFDERKQLIERTLKRWEARIFQHEYDHLNGALCMLKGGAEK